MGTTRTRKRSTVNPRDTTLREAKFCAAYLISLDAAEAARAAGYSEKGARQQGSRILRRPHIQAAIREKQAEALAAIQQQAQAELAPLDMTAERIKREIFTLAQLDPGQCFHEDGTPIAVHQLPPHVRACIKKISAREDLLGNVTTTIEFWDKVKALDLAARHLNLILPPAREVNVNHKFPHAHLSDAELQQKLLEASHALAGDP